MQSGTGRYLSTDRHKAKQARDRRAEAALVGLLNVLKSPVCVKIEEPPVD